VDNYLRPLCSSESIVRSAAVAACRADGGKSGVASSGWYGASHSATGAAIGTHAAAMNESIAATVSADCAVVVERDGVQVSGDASLTLD
jgi:hypothetical protein